MSSILKPGERIHVVLRRLFETEARRHFAGVVQSATDTIAKVDGWPWLYDAARKLFVRSPDKRTRLISLVDSANVVHLLPPELDVEDLRYDVLQGGRYAITDGGDFRMEVNEAGPQG